MRKLKSTYPWDHTGYLFVSVPEWSRKHFSIDCWNPSLLTCSLQRVTVKHSFKWLWEHQKKWASFPTSCKKSVLVHMDSSCMDGMDTLYLGKAVLLWSQHHLRAVNHSGTSISSERQRILNFDKCSLKIANCCSYILRTSFFQDFRQCLCPLRSRGSIDPLQPVFSLNPLCESFSSHGLCEPRVCWMTRGWWGEKTRQQSKRSNRRFTHLRWENGNTRKEMKERQSMEGS